MRIYFTPIAGIFGVRWCWWFYRSPCWTEWKKILGVMCCYW